MAKESEMKVQASVTRAGNAPLLLWDTIYRYVFGLECLEILTYITVLKRFWDVESRPHAPSINFGWMVKVFGGGLRNGSLFYVSSPGRNSHHT